VSELFTKIANFYGGDSMLRASFTELGFLVSTLGRSLVAGDAIEVSSFDGYISKRRKFEQTSRLDTIVCLARITALLETKLKEMPAKELEALDRMQQMTAELPKRLSDPDL